MNERISTFSGLKALSPLAVFLLLYVGFSLSAGDFYAVPISVAFLISCLYAVLILRHRPWEERFALLTEGARRPGLLMMVWIFVLAGAFTGAAQAIGAIAREEDVPILEIELRERQAFQTARDVERRAVGDDQRRPFASKLSRVLDARHAPLQEQRSKEARRVARKRPRAGTAD